MIVSNTEIVFTKPIVEWMNYFLFKFTLTDNKDNIKLKTINPFLSLE